DSNQRFTPSLLALIGRRSARDRETLSISQPVTIADQLEPSLNRVVTGQQPRQLGDGSAQRRQLVCGEQRSIFRMRAAMFATVWTHAPLPISPYRSLQILLDCE